MKAESEKSLYEFVTPSLILGPIPGLLKMFTLKLFPTIPEMISSYKSSIEIPWRYLTHEKNIPARTSTLCYSKVFANDSINWFYNSIYVLLVSYRENCRLMDAKGVAVDFFETANNQCNGNYWSYANYLKEVCSRESCGLPVEISGGGTKIENKKEFTTTTVS